jgi:short-subunit dehydrogenase
MPWKRHGAAVAIAGALVKVFAGATPSPDMERTSMTAIRGAAAALTGAASGIGRALALELGARGCDLALADRDEAGLQAVAAEIARRHQCKVTVHHVDVGEPRQIADFAQAAISAHPSLNILINNAGVTLLGQFQEIDQAEMEWLMNINFWGVVHGTRAFLPHLSGRREAHIVNLSSLFGLIAPPGQTAYVAAKFAVRGFSESLRHELQAAQSPVRLSVVHPGGVATNIVRNARSGAGVTDNARRAQAIERFDRLAKTAPEAAALRIIAGIENNQPRILIGNDARFMDLLQRLRPATYWAPIARRIEKMTAGK